MNEFVAVIIGNAVVESRYYLWLTRGMILSVAGFLVWGVWYAWRTHPKFVEDAEQPCEEEVVS